jgi:hypothetical protein
MFLKTISTNFVLIFFDEVIYQSIQQTQMVIQLVVSPIL